MRVSTTFPLILLGLFHVTWVSASDSCTEVKGLPIAFNQINGLWNLKAIASRHKLEALNEMQYSYAKISLTEKEGTIKEFANPLESNNPEPVHLERVEKETLAYRKVIGEEKDDKLLTFLQVHPDVLIIHSQLNELIETSVLYVRSTLYPESELKHFKEWIKCKELPYFKEFTVTVDYAHKCYGVFEETSFPAENKNNVTSWHLVAKSSKSVHRHYNVRILYTARLEISRNEEEYTLKEIITAPTDNVLLELKFGKSIKEGSIVMTFKTEDGLLLLGVHTDTGRTLYLASRTPTVRQSVIEKFKAQAVCFETKYNYFIPGTIREDGAGAEACANELEKKVPINFRDFVGKWILTAAAHEDTEAALQYILSTYGETEISIVNDKVHLSHTEISQGTIKTLDNIEVEESTGHIIYKEKPSGIRAAIHSVSPNCILLSPEGQRLFLNCHENHTPSMTEITQFVKYASCLNFNKILIRQPASNLCSKMPAEVQTLDVQKLVGTWKLAAAASNIPDGAAPFPHEIQFTVDNGEVKVTDGTATDTVQRLGNNRLQFAEGDKAAMEMRFYEPLGDTLLTWIGNPKHQNLFLALFSKTGHATPDELTRFKNFASCLSIRVAFLKE